MKEKKKFWFGVLTKLPRIQKSRVFSCLSHFCSQNPAFPWHAFGLVQIPHDSDTLLDPPAPRAVPDLL